MGPKVIAACWFAEVSGNRAAIGAMEDLEKIVAGEAGTVVRSTGRAKDVFGMSPDR
jgi:carbamate kinase